MKSIVNNEKYGVIVYEESFWTGKKSLKINGQNLRKIGKTNFIYSEGEVNKNITLKGNFISGVSLMIGTEKVEMSPKSKWYEYILAFIAFVFVVVWGSSPDLCAIFPVVGGAIGGAITGAMGIVNIAAMKSTKNPLFKILIGLGIAAGTILICYLIAVAILSAV